MRIALLGGTGDIGEGLALQVLAHTDHEVVIGSREAERAQAAAARYGETLAEHGFDGQVDGAHNRVAAQSGEIVILCVPPYHVRDTVKTIADGLDAETVLVTPAVGMRRTETGCQYDPPDIGSVTELVAKVAPDEVPVVGAYHSLPAGRLADLSLDFEMDAPMVADDAAAKEAVWELTDTIPGLRPVDAGALANAAGVESVTALLVTIAGHNEQFHDLGVRFT
jgi:NADPH-dependent F420 reductase